MEAIVAEDSATIPIGRSLVKLCWNGPAVEGPEKKKGEEEVHLGLLREDILLS